MSKIKLGVVARDLVTGFEGTITGRAEYLTGCTQLLLVPKCAADGRFIDGQWFDDKRVEVVARTPIVLGDGANGPDTPAPKR